MPRSLGARAFSLSLVPPLHSALVLYFRERVFHRVYGVVICEVEFGRHVGILGLVKYVLLFRRSVEHDLLLFIRKLAEGHVGAHAHGAAYVRHQRPHQRVPRRHCALVYGQAVVGHERASVHAAHYARTAAGRTGALTVEREFFGGGRVETRAALGAYEFTLRGDRERRRQIVPVGAAVARQPRIHQPQAVEQLGARAESAAYAGHGRTLVQCERRGDVRDVIHLRLRRLRHAPARICGQRVEISPRAFGVQHAERERGFARPGHARDSDDPVQGNVHVYVFQIVHPRSADLDVICHNRPLSFFLDYITFIRGGQT